MQKIRKVLNHSRTKIEWNTPYLTYEDKCKLILQIRNGFKYGIGIYKEKSASDISMIGKMIMILEHFISQMFSSNMEVFTMVRRCIYQSEGQKKLFYTSGYFNNCDVCCEWWIWTDGPPGQI